jgi:hypothetical protein
MQRLRIKFRRGAEIKFISHLDIVRLWQRAFNRAGIEIAYSSGFTPHAKISLAAPCLWELPEKLSLWMFISSEALPHTSLFQRSISSYRRSGSG